MTYKELKDIIEKNNIPENVKLQSDSGWECDPTDMDGVFYNKSKNIIIFTQGCWQSDEYFNKPGFITLFHKREPEEQGTWILHKDYNERKYGCNQCGNLNDIPSKFCPNCGANMRNLIVGQI